MRRIVIVLAGFAVISVVADSRLSGQSATASLSISASVSKNCTITTAPVSFGNYDSVTANATAPLDGIGTITVKCTKGAAAKVGLNPGADPTGTTRRMKQGTEYLTYELYKDASRTTAWGDTATTALDIPAAPNQTPRDFTVYGRVPQAQDATVCNYADTVVATVNF